MANGNRTQRDSKSYTFTMTTPDVVWSCAGAVFALTVFFLFGVLVGRGYLPNEPADQMVAEGQEQVAHGQLAGEDGAGNGDPGEPGEKATASPEVLKPEELAFQDQLEKPAETVEEAAKAAAEIAAQGETAAAEAASGADEATEAAEEVEEAAKTYDPANLPEAEPGEKIFHYTYQAAAFKDENAAIGLASTLKEHGLPAEVSKGVTTSATWYRVQIPFTGTPTQTRPLRDAVKTVTGQKPVMVSKKAQ